MQKRIKIEFPQTNRIFYIGKRGELFVQFRPDKDESLNYLRDLIEGGTLVHYVEELPGGHRIAGDVSRATLTGISLVDWKIV